MDFELQSYGERAILINKLDENQQFGLIGRLEVSPPKGFVEYVLGHVNLLVIFDSGDAFGAFSEWLRDLEGDYDAEVNPGYLVEVPVRYDGQDLNFVAESTDLAVEEVVAIHSRAEYRVRLMGFAPGFPYLEGLDPRLHLERRPSPRNYIEPGTVAIGGSHAGIYSVGSPGGWHLLGSTEFPLFQPHLAKLSEPKAAEVFGLRPGDRVKFIPIQ